MRAAIYARVSSAAQRDAHTIENQLRALPAYVASQGWELVETYIDDGRSAKTGMLDRRDAFERLMRSAEAHGFDVLVVVDVDRLTRTNSIEERAQILGPFQRLGITIATPTGGVLDLRSFLGEFWVTVQALVAAEENRKRAERIMAGKLRAIAEGRKPAGPTPYGLKYDRATATWSIDELAAAVVREVYARVIAGESCWVIADDFYVRGIRGPRSVWTRHGLWALVRARHTVGEWTADKKRKLVVKVPAIIDEATWQAADRALVKHGKRGLVRMTHDYLLDGLGVCSLCGAPMAIRTQTKGRGGMVNAAAYVCRTRKLARLGAARCPAPIVRVDDADARVWAAVAELLDSPELAAKLEARAREVDADACAWEQDLKEWRGKLAKLDKHEAAVIARHRRELIGEAAFDTELEVIARERRAYTAQVDAALRAAAAAGDEPRRDPGTWLAALRELATGASAQERRAVVRALVRPAGAVFVGTRVKLTLRVEEASRVSSAGVHLQSPAVVPVLRTHRRELLVLELVA